MANKGNWEYALEHTRDLSTDDIPLGNRQAYAEMIPIAKNAAKKAWERAHGRTITEADITQAHIAYTERSIAEYVKEYDKHPGSWRISQWEEAIGRKMIQADEIRICGKPFQSKVANLEEQISRGPGAYIGGMDAINNFIEEWEKETGRKFTGADRRRIARGGSYNSSSTGGGSILFSIIGAIVVAIIGFNILGWLGLIGGAIGGFFLGKWLSAR